MSATTATPALRWLEVRGRDGTVTRVEGYLGSSRSRPVAACVRTLRGWRPELRERWMGSGTGTLEMAKQACLQAVVRSQAGLL